MKLIPVRCTVSTCHYWRSGNECHADQILVTSDSFANSQPDSVDALVADTLGSTPTGNCMETCCKTFVSRDFSSEAQGLDGVRRQ